MRSIRYGNFRIDIVDTVGGQVERVGHRAPAEALLRPRFRPSRAMPVPLGRERQAAEAVRDLRGWVPIEIQGPCGIGKSTLLRYIAAYADSRLGVPGVYVQVSAEDDIDDVLQRLVRRLYTFDQPAKLTADECAALLRWTRVVVALDDVPFDPQQVASLLQILSGCGIVLGCTRPIIGRHGRSHTLSGLPDDDAVEMVRRALGRPLDGPERAALSRLTAAVEGQPLRLRQAAALVDADEHSFADLADRAERDPAELDRLSVGALAESERRLLAVLAFTAGALLPRDLLDAIGDIQRVDEALSELRRRGLADHSDDRFGLPVCRMESYRRLLYRSFDLAGTARDIVDYLAASDPSGDQSLSAVNAVLTLIEYAAERGEWATVARLARAAEQVLTLAGRWHAANHVLDLGLQAAQAIADTAMEALFAHQRGTLALCQDDRETAREHLSRALELREQLGDDRGAEVTRHNLALMSPIPVPHLPPSPRPKGGWRELRRPLTVTGLVIAILTVVLGAVARALPEPPDPRPSPTWSTTIPSPTPTATPTRPPTTSPSRTTPPPSPRPPRLIPGGDFGAINISPGQPPATRVFTVTNPDSRPITLASPTISGDRAFRVDPGNCAGVPLGPQDGCRLTVTFAPTRLGDHLATLTVSDRNGSTTSTALTGTGYVELHIDIAGAPGTVQVSDPRDGCQADCTVRVTKPAVTLTATPKQEWPSTYFYRWNGPCMGNPEADTCAVLLSADTRVTANFRWVVE